MTTETGFLGILREMTQDAFRAAYLANTEHHWRTMPMENLAAWIDEVERRGLAHSLADQIGEIALPTDRWMKQRSSGNSEAPSSDTSTSPDTSETITLSSGQTMTREEALAAWENAKRQLAPVMRLLGISPKPRTQSDFVLTAMEQSLPEASTGSGETSIGEESAVAAALAKPTDQPSSEERPGVRTSAGNGYGMVAYQRLPLAGKRDAFIAEGFLYVRNDKLKEWFGHLRAGRCCPAAQEGAGHHSSDCWIG